MVSYYGKWRNSLARKKNLDNELCLTDLLYE